MHVSADEEREYYDGFYRQFLECPDGDLAFTQKTFMADLNNPRKPVFERRLLFTMAAQRLFAEDLSGRSVLEYGCGTGDWGLLMADRGASVTFLDLSPVAVEVALRRAQASGVAARSHGVAWDATDLSRFPDGGFDVVFAAFALHHTLKHAGALAEIHRILRAGGTLLLAETYGNNNILNAARTGWRFLSREPAEQGEGIVIGDAEIGSLSALFTDVAVEPVNFLAMAKRLFRGHFTFGPVVHVVRALEAADAFLLARFPGLRRYCGEVLVTAVK
jgi:SAM-dependent methyltransferase